MDAAKFIEERNKMCYSFRGRCNKCPAGKNDCCYIFEWKEELIKIVEKFSQENHRKTRQDLILEQLPNAETCKDKVLSACPKVFDSNFVCHFDFQHNTCNDCRSNFWLEEVD